MLEMKKGKGLEKLRFSNQTSAAIEFTLEPDGMNFVISPGSVFEVVFEDLNDTFDVEIKFNPIIEGEFQHYSIYGKYPASVFQNGEKIYPEI
jgi:hypothetical protein